MSAYNPPTYYFPGIQYNDAFFTSSSSSPTLAYITANFLQRVGNPTSTAVSTTFNGILYVENILPLINESYNIGSSTSYFQNGYFNNLYANNTIVSMTETQNDPLYLLNSVPTASNLNAGIISGVGIGYSTVTATSNTSNITTVVSSLNPGVGVTIVLYGLTTHTEYNELQFVTLSSTSTYF